MTEKSRLGILKSSFGVSIATLLSRVLGFTASDNAGLTGIEKYQSTIFHVRELLNPGNAGSPPLSHGICDSGRARKKPLRNGISG